MRLGLARRRAECAHLDWWPQRTTVLANDIVIAGVSLQRLVDACGTPVVQSGASVNETADNQPPTSERVEVLVVRVVAMAVHRAGCPVIQVDARLDNLRLIWSQLRSIGGVQSHRNRNVLVVRKPSMTDLEEADDVIAVSLPASLRVGDLLAVPSRPIPVDPAHPRHPLTGRPDGAPESIFAGVSSRARPGAAWDPAPTREAPRA
jgi:hypothetical protein